MVKKQTTLILFITLIFFSSNIWAQNYGISFRASTMGINADIARSFGNKLNLRLGAAVFSYSFSGDYESNDKQYKLNYTPDYKPFSIHLLADYFPFENNFRLTGGIVINTGELNLNLNSAKNIEITDNNIYTPEEIGELNSEFTFNTIAPYFSIGFGNVAVGKGLKFSIEAGTFYQGSPKVTLSGTRRVAPTACKENEEQLEENLNWFKFYPVFSIGLTYVF